MLFFDNPDQSNQTIALHRHAVLMTAAVVDKVQGIDTVEAVSGTGVISVAVALEKNR